MEMDERLAKNGPSVKAEGIALSDGVAVVGGQSGPEGSDAMPGGTGGART